MKFRKRIRVFPGFTINLSRSGMSSTVGIPGLSLNFSKNGAALNTGIPGTGLYDRQYIGKSENQRVIGNKKNLVNPLDTADNSRSFLTSTDLIQSSCSLQDFCKEIQNALDERLDAQQALPRLKKDTQKKKNILILSRIFLIGWFIPTFKKQYEHAFDDLKECEAFLQEQKISIDLQSEEDISSFDKVLSTAFEELCNSHFIWDITTFKDNQNQSANSRGSKEVSRVLISLDRKEPPFLSSNHECLHFQNINGGHLYFYPHFLLIIDDILEVKLLEYKDIEIEFIEATTREMEVVAPDATTAGIGYLYERKNGQPDLRYKYNQEVPKVTYAILKFTSRKGLDEVYKFSALEKAQRFHQAFQNYRSLFSST